MTIWTTRADEPVEVGDLVALSVLKYADAVGRIVAESPGGQVQCVLLRGGRPGSAGTTVLVEPDQLLVKVYE